MSKQDDILRLLVAEESLNDAEMLISVLRNAGQAVRASQAEDAEDLQQALAEKTFDLFLCSTGMAELSLDEATRQIQHSGKDLPLIAISETDDADVRREAMRIGATDLVSKQDLEHLAQVLQRELRNLRDRRRLRRLEASLRETEKRCAVLLDSSRDAIAYVHEGMHLYANRAYLERFGVESFDDIEGMPILDMIAPDDQGAMKDFLRRYNKGDHSKDQLELSIVSEGDVPSLAMLHFSPASIDGEPCTQILMREQADNRELEAQLDTLSKQDLLSGLYNRPYFMEHLQRLISDNAGGAEHSHGLLYVALDNLDQVQQTLGITAIDQLITDVAALIRAEQGDQGLAARFSDDAFTVVLEQAGVHDTIALGEAIRHAVEALVTEAGGRTVTTTCSIGVAMVADASSAQQAMDAAHQAADVARSQGGNRVHLPTPNEDGEHSEAAGEALRELVESAADEERFHLVFQPVASLQGETVERYEVRLRMQDRNGALVMPEQFISPAEKWGLLPAIDRWVMRQTIRVLQQRSAQATELMVKLSGPTLEDESFLVDVAQALKDAGTEGSRLIFQLNEPVAVTQINQAKQYFRGLKELNCGFCLDHFGSGLNPFQLVKHLPADYLKLDTTLTAHIGGNEETQQACKQVIDNAHELHKKVIAGYLEDVSSMATLWQFGADYVQGNFLQEPERDMHYDFSGMVI